MPSYIEAMTDSESSFAQAMNILRDPEKIEKETRKATAANTKSLRAFINPEKAFSIIEARDVVKQLKLESSVSADTVLQLRNVTLFKHIKFNEYTYIIQWIRSCIEVWSGPNNMNDEEMQKLVSYARDFAKIMCTPIADEPVDADKAAKEIGTIMPADDASLQAFIDPKQDFDGDKARNILELFKLGDSVTVDTALQLRRVVTESQSDQFIEHRILYRWLRFCLSELATSDQTNMSDGEMKELALTVRRYANGLLAPVEDENIGVDMEHANRLLEVIAHKFRQNADNFVEMYHVLHSRTAASKNRTFKEGTTMESIWQQYGNFRDESSARALWFEGFDFMHQSYAKFIIGPVHGLLTDTAESLEKVAAYH